MFTKDLRPTIRTRYASALAVLQASGRTRIGHIDCGVVAHPALGYSGHTPPAYLRLDEGRDFLSDDPDAPPVTDLKIGGGVLDALTDYPDHGIKTLSCILSNTAELRGVAPEVQVIPVRIADGPIFQNVAQRNNMGRAMAHLMTLDPLPSVISISMGNPGILGLLQPAFSGLDQRPGFNRETRALFDQAYEQGIIVICAAGQVIDRVVYPARYGRTIAVGGFSHDRVRHYPDFDYDIPERVDIYAQADGINRAFVRIEDDGSITRGYAEDEGTGPRDISGTSYATPQVAAAAALWAERFFHDLPALGSAEAWRRVEAFRKAVRETSDVRALKITVPRRKTLRRRTLNIERLLGRAPDLDAAEKKAPAARFWGSQL